MDLGLEADELAACVSCGLCLPHCPTYRVTGDDAASPRGRIWLMRAIQNDGAPLTPGVIRSIQTCVQCLGCETACPSGVPFGHLIEGTRDALADTRHIAPRWQRIAFGLLGRHRLVLAGSSMLGVAQRLGIVPSRRLGLPARLPIRRRPLTRSGSDVHLFTGCVMDAWQRDVHLAVQEVMEATGAGVNPTGGAAPCCGALSAHAGLRDQARARAREVMAALDDEAPIVVDSAGCGAALEDYGRLLGTDEAESFSKRVLDVHEWLEQHLDELPRVRPLDLTVTIQDPCHLRHVQRAHLSVRAVLTPFVRAIVELDDEGLCCGAGGAYSVVEPELAGAIRERKLSAIARAGGDIVASANPGCSIHLAAAGIDVVHPLELVARALRGERS